MAIKFLNDGAFISTIAVQGSGDSYFTGNVGIGTTSPDAKLQVETTGISNTAIFENSGQSFSYTAIKVGEALGNRANLTFVVGDNLAATDLIGEIGCLITSDGGALEGAMSFKTNSGDTLTERMVISSAGALRFNAYGAGTLITDASGNITVSSGGGAGGPYLPLAGGTMTGSLIGTTIGLTGGITANHFRTNAGSTDYNLFTRDGTGNTIFVQAAQSNASQPIAKFSYGSAVVNAGTAVLQVSKDNSHFVNCNVGIGTTSPDYKLQVNAGSNIASFKSTGSGENEKELLISSGGDRTILSSKNTDGTGADLAFSTGSFESMRIDSDGNVGIGTNNPTAMLHIRKDDATVYDPSADDGQRGVGATIQLNNNSTTTNTFGQIMYDTDSSNQAVARIVFLDAGTASSAMAFVTENGDQKGERMRIAADGKVGIGTDSPAEKLQVNGRVYIEQQGTNWNETTPGLARGALHFDPVGDGANNTGNAITFGASDTPGSPNQGSNAQAGIYTRTDDSFGTKMYFATTDSYVTGSKTAMMIDSTGVTSFTSTPIVLTRTASDNTTRAASTAFVTAALGSLPTPFEFNTTTTSGIQSVQASGSTNAATGASSIAMGVLAEASGNGSTAMGFRTEASATKSTAMGGETTASGDYSTAMGFQTTASGYASTAMGRLTTPTGQYSTAMGFQTTASGNFSIAMGYQTTASGINSTAIGGSTTASGIASTAISSNTTASGFASVAIGQYNVLNTSDNAFAFAATNTAFSIGNGTGSSSRSDAFKVLFNGNTTIDGNTYIGTAGTPNGTSIYGSAFTSSSNGRMILRLASDSTANRGMIILYNPNGAVGSILTNGSSTTYSTSSDYRLKEDLKDFNGLEMVSNISVYNYKWKVDETRSYGVMAHELQEVLPDAVSGEKDAEEMQGVDYSKIVPLLIKSIQELTAKVERLEAK